MAIAIRPSAELRNQYNEVSKERRDNSRQQYEHKAQYYETDQMGIIHHSNYIRWFEEARVDMMEKAGMPYEELEKAGIVCAVIEVSCAYKTMVRFGDTVIIEVKLIKYHNAIMELNYCVYDKKTMEIRCTGNTKHCFLDKEGKITTLRKSNPRYHQLFLQLTEAEEQSET